MFTVFMGNFGGWILEEKMGVFNKNLLGIFRIGTLFWTIRVLARIYWCFGEWRFWSIGGEGFCMEKGWTKGDFWWLTWELGWVFSSQCVFVLP